jgi:hypothetical protein
MPINLSSVHERSGCSGRTLPDHRLCHIINSVNKGQTLENLIVGEIALVLVNFAFPAKQVTHDFCLIFNAENV